MPEPESPSKEQAPVARSRSGACPDAAARRAGPAEHASAVPTSREPDQRETDDRDVDDSAMSGNGADDALRLVADASAVLASTLDLDEVLEAVGRIAVPRLADVCVLDLVGDHDGPTRRCLVASSYDAATESEAREYLQRFPAPMHALDGEQARRLAAGEPVLMGDLGDAYYERIVRATDAPERRAILARLHPLGAIAVPLVARGQTLGVMSLITTASPRTPSSVDVALARELGHRVAQAILNARLYAEARRNEARLALALAGGEQGFWDWDVRADRTFVDDRLYAILGRTRAELGDRPEEWLRLVHPADEPRVREGMRAHMAGETVGLELEYRMRHADGSWRWILSRGGVVERDADGRPVRLAGTHTDVTARRRADDSRELLAHTLEAIGDLVATFDPEGRLLYVNPAGLRLVGVRELERVLGHDFLEFHVPEEREQARRAFESLRDGAERWKGEFRLLRFDGRPPVLVEADKLAVRDPVTDELTAYACVARDLTERRAIAAERERLAEQARHAQRIESLGVLAGGVAHDFNNLLTVILSTVDLVRADLPCNHTVQEDLDAIRGAATRASQLTRQLLAFSRRQVLETRLLDLNAVVLEADGMLKRLVGDRVAIDTSLAPGRLPVRADPVQLEQVLVNLVLNARDAVAMAAAARGVISVETGETTLAADAAARLALPSGKYVCMTVHDTGVGMDAETKARVFEPFFTTKPLGQGTGLGLAMVYGIVTQSGGAVTIESTPGRGSTFRVLLPHAAEEGAERAPQGEHATPQRGRETVLLVEDEAAVRDVARRILERAGYTVYEARHGADALLVWREQGGARGNIDVLLTDLRMPELDGRELAAALRRERPNLPVVFVSGYAEGQPGATAVAPAPAARTNGRVAERAVEYAARVPGESFLAKPFVAPELQRALREVLDAHESAA